MDDYILEQINQYSELTGVNYENKDELIKIIRNKVQGLILFNIL